MALEFQTRHTYEDDFDFGGSSSESEADERPIRRGGAKPRKAPAAQAIFFSLGGATGSQQEDALSGLSLSATATVIAAYASESARSAASAVEEDASSDEEALAIFDRSAAGFTATQVQERQAAPHSPRSASRPAEAALGGASSAPAAASSAAGGGAESTMRSLLHTPVAPGKTLQCFVTRSKTGLGLGAPTWSLFLESTEEFLCAARKRSGQRSSNYLISRDAYPVDRKSPQVLGKVRGNVVGSMYIVYDHGLAPDKAVTASARRRELACIAFDYDRMGPGRMAVRVPQVSGSRPLEIRPAGEEDSMVAAVGDHPLARCVVSLRNKTPHWDERLQGHVLNFKGRVSQASVKNFQLETADQTSAADDCPLQFGRVDKNRFTLDVSWPLSPLQAFGIVLASLDPKLADTKSYDALKRSLEAAEVPSSDEEVAAAQGGGHSMLSRMFGSAGKK